MKGLRQGLGFAAAKLVLVAARASSTPERPLSASERALLAPIYRDSVELGRVRIRAPFGGMLNVSDRAFVIEDTVFVPKRFLPLSPSVLVHEICHVWQHQHGGHAYIADSVQAQLWGDGYQLEKGLREGRRWSELNCEQQATLIEEAFDQRCFDGRPLMLNGRNYTEAFQLACAELWAGRGAAS